MNNEKHCSLEENMQEKLEDISKLRKKSHQKFLSMNSKTYNAFLEMERVTFADGHLPAKEKELIALGISVVINCESCIQWHTEQASKAGATEEEVLEAIEVAIEMRGGPATVSARLALAVMEKLYEEKVP